MVVLGILRVGVDLLRLRGTKGNYQRFAVHDQKLGVLWMTKDHIEFPS